MSTLSNENVSFDGMRDVFDTLNSNSTSTSAWSLNNQKHIDRSPVLNGGQGDGKVPQNSLNQNEATSTTTMSADDFKSVFKIDSGRVTNSSGSNKNQQQNTWTGWGTNNGVYYGSLQQMGSSQSTGTAYDGTSSYTAFGGVDFEDLSDDFESNKQVIAFGYMEAGFFTLALRLVFSGSNASASDTDWTTVHFRTVRDSYGLTSEADAVQVGFQLNRTAATTASYTVAGVPHIVYSWNLPAPGSFPIANSTTFIKFT